MKKYLSQLTILLFINLTVHAQTANYTWAQHFGRAGGNASSGADLLATDHAGNIYVSGNYSGTGITFGSTNITPVGTYNGYIAKLDPNGNAIWAKSTHLIQAGWDGDGNPDKIVVDSFGNVYLCGFFFAGAMLDNIALTGDNNYFLARLDSIGNVLWIRTTTTQLIYKSLNAIHLDAQQHICMTGLYQASIGFDSNFILANASNSAGVDAFLTKYDTAGNVISATELGVINPLWSNQNYPHELFQYDNEDNLYRFVTQDAVLAKYTANGILMNMDTILAVAGTLSVQSFAVDKNKNILMSGCFSNGPLIFENDTIYNNVNTTDLDAIVLKLNASNNLLWNYHFATAQMSNYYLMIRTDEIGSVYALCREGSPLGIGRIAVTKLSASGSVVWNNYISNTNPPLFTIFGFSFQPNTIVTAYHGGNVLLLGGFAGSNNPNTLSQGYIFFNPLLNFTISPTRNDIFIAQLGTCDIPSPTITSTASGFCNGDSISISASSSSQYLWSTNDTSNSIFVSDHGNYFMYAADTLGCYAKSNELYIDEYALPVISINTVPGNPTICEGESIILNGTGAITYTWSGGINDNTAFIPPVGSTTYTLTGTDANGCSNANTQTVIVNPNVTPTISISSDINQGNIGDAVVYTATTNLISPYIISWYRNNIFQTSTTNNSWNTNIVLGNNSVKAIISAATQCLQPDSAASNIAEVILNEGIAVYPNPATNEITITGLMPNDDIGLFNSIGQKILAFTGIKILSDQNKLPLKNISSGTYVLSIKRNKEVFVKKIIKVNQ